MGRVKRHNECGLVVGQLGFHNPAPPGVIPKVRVFRVCYETRRIFIAGRDCSWSQSVACIRLGPVSRSASPRPARATCVSGCWPAPPGSFHLAHLVGRAVESADARRSSTSGWRRDVPRNSAASAWPLRSLAAPSAPAPLRAGGDTPCAAGFACSWLSAHIPRRLPPWLGKECACALSSRPSVPAFLPPDNKTGHAPHRKGTGCG